MEHTELFDQCHDHCVPAGDDPDAIYLPFAVVDGTGIYACNRGHLWTCGWGTNLNALDMGYAGRPLRPGDPQP